MPADISRRIWITRYLMVIGIIILHMPPYQPLSEAHNSAFDFIKAFFSHGVFRATVPVLTAMSGFLVFRSGLYLKPLVLFKKKFMSIALPLILWNLPLVLVIFMIQKHNLLSHEFSAILYPFDFMSWLTATTGALGLPVNYPLNFLRDLFIVSLLSPLLWLLLKRIPYIGLIVVLVVYFYNLDGELIIRNSMLVSFYIGALAACRNWDLTALDKYAGVALLAFISICLVIIVFKIENRELFRLISPVLVWPSMYLISKNRLGDLLARYSRSSFFTFLFHGPVIVVFWILFNKLAANIDYFIFWCLAPCLTVILAVWLDHLFKKVLPKVSQIALGGR